MSSWEFGGGILMSYQDSQLWIVLCIFKISIITHVRVLVTRICIVKVSVRTNIHVTRLNLGSLCTNLRWLGVNISLKI